MPRRPDPETKRRSRRDPRPEQSIPEIRNKLDDPELTKILQRHLHPDFQLELLKDKIAEEALDELVNHSQRFEREQLHRQECTRQAEKLWQVRFLEDDPRTRPSWSQLKARAETLEVRARGIYDDDQPAVIHRFFHKRTDRGLVYGQALLCLYAILRHVTTPGLDREIFFMQIADILQAFDLLRKNSKNSIEAIRKRFDRANGTAVIDPRTGKKMPQPVDFKEDFLFAIDLRFPRQPPVLDRLYYSTVTVSSPPATLPPPATAPTR